jgi:endonuclease/exonuclease/phosphatase family metal-dependent hydrolase
LQHIGAALEDGDGIALAELFTLGEELPFDKAPDPTELLERMNRRDDERPREDKARVTALDYNVALLDAHIFGIIPYKRTPDLDERKNALPGLIFARDADVIALQEVWRPEDVDTFLREGEQHGYRGFHQPRDDHNDGVMIFVRESSIAGGTTPELVDYAAYASQDGLEYFPGPGIRRGWIEVLFDHADAGRVRVFATHMQAFPEGWLGRMHQARELGMHARDDAARDDLVLVMGDLNSGPFYVRDKWLAPGDVVQSAWLENTIAYPLLLEYGELIDTAIMGRPADLANDDVQLGKTVKNDPEKSTEVPGVTKGWCDDTPITTLTATDCNSLYFAQYAGTEYPARLDHIHARDREDLVVVRSDIVFTEKQEFANSVSIEPSDHYGVEVELLVDRK